jgi:hypothetical protein
MTLSLLGAALLGAANLPAPLTIDFDGDRRPDRVVAENGWLVGYRAKAPRKPVRITQIAPDNDLFLEPIAPGEYTTACARGAGDVKDCTVKQVRFSRPVVGFGTREASLFAAQWKGRRFEVVALSD